MIHNDMIRIVQMLNLITVHARDTSRIKHPLILSGTQRHFILNHNRLHFLSLNIPPPTQSRINQRPRPRRLFFGPVHKNGVYAVEIGIYHQRSPAS